MKPKSIFETKTFWLSLLFGALTAINEVIQGLALSNTELVGIAVILNIILRFFTERPVKLA